MGGGLILILILILISKFGFGQGLKRETRFTSKHPAPEIISKMEETARPLGFKVEKRDYKVTMMTECLDRQSHASNIISNMYLISSHLNSTHLNSTHLIGVWRCQMRLQGAESGRKGHLSIATEVSPISFFKLTNCLSSSNPDGCFYHPSYTYVMMNIN